MAAQENPSVYWRIAKAALVGAAILGGLSALSFAIPMVLSSIGTYGIFGSFSPTILLGGMKALAATILNPVNGILSTAATGALIATAWRTTQELLSGGFKAFLPKRTEKPEPDKSASPEISESKSRGRGQQPDYSGLYDKMGINPSGNMAERVQQQSAANILQR